MLLALLVLAGACSPEAPPPPGIADGVRGPANGAGRPGGPPSHGASSPGTQRPPGPPQGGVNQQDPTGFPKFHDTPPPAGPAPEEVPAARPPTTVAALPLGGFRPQVEVGADGTLHAVYYDHRSTGDLLWYRQSHDGITWSEPEMVSTETGRNWGPDMVVRPDGRVIVVWDRADEQFRGQGWLRERGPAGWEAPVALTAGGNVELSSGHVAAVGSDLVYVYIEKPMSPQNRFVAKWRWRTGGTWSEPSDFSDGKKDAWHANISARPDGSVLATYDVGQGGGATTLYVVEGRAGSFGRPEALAGVQGERLHFAHPGGTDLLTWFLKTATFPRQVFAAAGRPGAWGAASELSRGLGGYHYDPFAVTLATGEPMVVWAYDGGTLSTLAYAVQRAGQWTAARMLEPVGSGKAELPSVSVGPDGGVHAVWAQGVAGTTAVWHAELVP